MVDALERRRAVRVSVVIPVEVHDGRGFLLHGTRDISTAGVFFDRAIPHAVGAQVTLAFTLPGDEVAIRCAGEVANVPDAKGYGMGIRFVGLTGDDQARIEAFTQDLLSRESQ
jgi:hypothetical protein